MQFRDLSKVRMQLILLVFLSCVVAAGEGCRSHSSANEQPVAKQPSAAEAIAQADQLYTQREDLARIRQGIALLRQARTADYSNYDAAWRLAKFNYYLATHTEDGERDNAFREGIEAGKEAVRLQSSKPDGHFWLGANYGGSAQAGSLAGLATVEDIRGEMSEVLKLDESYQDGSAYMVLGMVDLNAPKLLGGDPQKAVSNLEKGLRFGSMNALLRLHLAEAYTAVGRTDDARRQLDAIITMAPDPNHLPEQKEAVAEAHRLMEKINGAG